MHRPARTFVLPVSLSRWSHHTLRTGSPQPDFGTRNLIRVTNIIANMNGTIRQVCRTVKGWQDASMALLWTSAAILEAAKGFRRLKAHQNL